jgi:small subunit ribosomal protein S17
MSNDRRKIRVGKIVSQKMDKTVVVSVEWSQPHRIYKKNVKRWNKFMVHDEENSCNLGDTVRIVETRPLSKTKRWKVTEIIQKGDVAEVQPGEITASGMNEDDDKDRE